MKNCTKIYLLLLAFMVASTSLIASVIVVGAEKNPVTSVLWGNGVQTLNASSLKTALRIAKYGDGILVLQNKYAISAEHLQLIAAKKLKVFLPCPSFEGRAVPARQKINLERVVVSTSEISGVDSLSILSVNDGDFFTYGERTHTLAYIAKIAGFDRAEYGIEDVKSSRFYLLRMVFLLPALISVTGKLHVSAHVNTGSDYGNIYSAILGSLNLLSGMKKPW